MTTLPAGAARHEWPAHDARDTVRYGVFLRPDAATCAATAALHTHLLERVAVDVDDDATTALAHDVEAALDGARGRTDTDYLTGQTSTARFHAHLTVAGQDVALRPDLVDEVAEFVAALAGEFPRTMTARHVQTFRSTSEHWPGRWWADMTWQLLASVPLSG